MLLAHLDKLVPFQFTPLREGRRPGTADDTRTLTFQFTPLREGRLCGFPTTFALQISIHAPPRGATPLSRRTGRLKGKPFQFTPLREGRHYARVINQIAFISIHAPPRGATKNRRHAPRVRDNFNSRPSARGDRIGDHHAGQSLISIHAPPRGATQGVPKCIAIFLFQFTPLREGRRNAQNAILNGIDFNSRPSARGDRNAQNAILNGIDFNSRPSARGD